MIPRFPITIAVAFGLFTFVVPAQAATPIAGKYLTEDGNMVVQVAPCGAALCGKVVKILKPKPGMKTVDGSVLLSDLMESGDMWKGKIHNPENGKSYNAKVKLNTDRSLKVQGCMGPICKGPTWTPTT